MPKYRRRFNTRSSKLSPDEVTEVRRLYHEDRWSQGELARKFNMSAVQIGRIVRGESHREVTDPMDDYYSPVLVEETLPVATQEELNRQAARIAAQALEPTPPATRTASPEEHAQAMRKLAELVRRKDDSQTEETRNDSQNTSEPSGPDAAPGSIHDRNSGSPEGT